ncbi:Cys-tRNA(Pro) deacylase [Ignavibacterium sp.]|uniref:Cys-tRNA(Pro) deacylase n=1 Tax=Ignavibacterium sp. TaxID=2651167 RepID=UPI00220DC97D|nr:Cys-tRNA(Pro) deacylase [Ignavibacterium sp.]BDQ03852.1 MAG: Cys-tRNA(Pro)/Cys-tRNA(Cys) deacylase [Ignavibacterium sp.]
MNKTNAIRILETHNISFDVKEYQVDENDLSGETVAEKIGADHEEVFKTLVAKGDKESYCVFCIPVNFELNLKKAAKASGNKNVELIKVKELFPLTGYVRGGCSPIGMKKLFPTFIDETAQLFERIYISAGVRGMQIHINPEDLKNLIEAEFADLI